MYQEGRSEVYIYAHCIVPSTTTGCQSLLLDTPHWGHNSVSLSHICHIRTNGIKVI